ncbi:MAG: SIR2 family protein [Pseudomonadota bacterium]|nr:SIR2 family protein [Pseudomonadota bacterium]MEE3100311.1 SIR2 family protein [Pseudomonadota bacterium]
MDESNITRALRQKLEGRPAAPFLFVGSGFSRRYLGLEDWRGLLQKFCANIMNFGFYSSKVDGDLPKTASLIAADFNQWWWGSDLAEQSRAEYANYVRGQADALKYEISKYVGSISLEDARGLPAGSEIATLSDVVIDGIITTNWDFFLEDLFPDYKVFVGQSELLFSNPQSIGEIYKIHGSASEPKSLVLTDEDYKEFSEKNPYLAAKLVTIFVEHPIVFLGYSIADPHIQSIIMSIAKCLTQEKIEEFQDNLIFVQRVKGEEPPSVERATLQFDEFGVTLTVVKALDFSDVYLALQGRERKIPVRLLRFFREQVYQLASTDVESEKRVAVVDLDGLEDADDVEFVVGVGVAQRQAQIHESLAKRAEENMAKKGYEGVSIEEVVRDAILDESKFDAADLLEAAYPAFGRSNSKFIPVFRYLRAIGIDSDEALAETNLEGAKKVVAKVRAAKFGISSYADRFTKSFAGLSTGQIIEKSTSPSEAALMLNFQPPKDVDAGQLLDFLRANEGGFIKQPYASSYNKLVCLYDRAVYGF